ncbi:hypothetical protein EVAR_66255_1 [Eumeta japonica]|uniref:Uncharacterized protein n=1 Tax=Eumeta variegata TaxID=151549 RepID=A0A4C1T3L8_EUMVA|nr:hypothetical protein EVAR_66255_1 [Eumeta japonica]
MDVPVAAIRIVQSALNGYVAVPKAQPQGIKCVSDMLRQIVKVTGNGKSSDMDTLPGTIYQNQIKELLMSKFLHKDINELLVMEPSAALVGEVLEPMSSAKLITTSTHSSAENSDITENLDSAILERLKEFKSP